MIIIEIIAVVVMFEIANKRESKTLFLHSIESFIMTSFTMKMCIRDRSDR